MDFKENLNRYLDKHPEEEVLNPPLRYFMGGREVTKEEYDRILKQGFIDGKQDIFLDR